MKYKVGDRVKFKENQAWKGEVTVIRLDYQDDPHLDNGYGYFTKSLNRISDLIEEPTYQTYKIIKKPLMKTLSNMTKKLLDADTQTLVKAGYINGDLNLTEEGEKVLLTIFFVANKTDLVTMATEKLAEEK